jgi:drug/metabolite transporter (DMT)-like permease
MNQIGVISLHNLFPILRKTLTHPRILIGFGFFGVGAMFWLAAISRVNLSWAYPMLSLGYVLVLVFSALLLHEHVSPIRWAGACVVCLGVYLIFRS